MIKIHTINNLGDSKNPGSKEHEEIASQIAILVSKSMAYSNSNTYSKDEMEGLSHNKTAKSMLNLINSAYVIYLTNETDELIGCGMVVKQHDRYFAKTLHIRPDYRGLGYAQKICDLREAYLRSIGEIEIYIESLKYPKTIAFHKKRGFVEMPPYRELKYTVFMKKEI
ncbi:GNAT family N-acetyltransferase [Marinisporobacter balticus]|uniref:Acetyltransferase (GNAT) family protein n=1 Tax=Marinisporobacter balticus TaxID=2018667 RepID=A0A4R2KWK0_9FIRM|nr:GNAT family N-acetyltransferase [Marinisporobacter balticus]TCO74618.1 acetyltransferase (GNAT) family protein [Marinisporobacter balticus]